MAAPLTFATGTEVISFVALSEVPQPSPVTLLEREDDLALISSCLSEAGSGTGSMLFIAGPAGIGKTELLAAAQHQARSSGFEVLPASGAELERDFAYGVVRQLLEPLLDVGAPERDDLLAGAAGLAAPLFGGQAPEAGAGGSLLDPSFAVVHGLYWLCANAARRRPLLCAVDDAHWADLASLRFLLYIGRRLEGLPLALIVAARPSEPGAPEELLARLAADPRPGLVEPRPLTVDGVGELLRRALRREPDPVFAAACHEATGGTPLLVRELARELESAAIAPTAAAAREVDALGPPTLTRAIRIRLGRLPPAAAGLARTVAVLGMGTDLRVAAALSGLSPDRAADAADALAAAGILEEGRPLRFVHPIVRSAVEADLSPGDRAGRHAAAARLLADEGASPDRLAAHLLAAEPAGDEWVVEVLRTAARGAVASGAPESAGAYLRRALDEPCPRPERPDVLLELGFAESYAGDPRAAGHLEAALETTAGSTPQVSMTLALGRMLQISGKNREALEVFDRTRARLAGTDRTASLTLEGAVLGAAQLDADSADEAWRRIARLRRVADSEDDVPPSIFGMLAIAASLANEPADEVAGLALRALAGAPKLLPEALDRPPFFYHACTALVFAERYDSAREGFDESLADARRLGSLPHVLGLSCYRALLHMRVGHLSDAEADARVALETGPSPPGFHAGLALAVLIEALAERGAFDTADEADGRYRLAEQFPTMVYGAWVLAARARVRLAQHRPAEALETLATVADLLARLRVTNPSLAPWRSDAALAHLALGAEAEARALADEEVAQARAFGALRALGVALRASGLARGGSEGLDVLREAVAVLAGSEARLEHARAVTDLGAALRRAGARAESRDVLRVGLDLAHRCGARVLTDRARTELVAAGGRPRRLALGGLDALTPSERRVAHMAAAGLSNREIAQQLFVTARTVEGHLTHAYQKLDITSRDQLTQALRETD